MCELLTKPGDFEAIVKQAVKKWYLNDDLKKYQPAYVYIHPAVFTSVSKAAKGRALTLPIRIDDTGQLSPGKVRICTDVQITEKF